MWLRRLPLPAALALGLAALYAAAFALARIGDDARASQLAATLEQRFPEDTSVKFNYVPTLRAMAALHAHDPAKAILGRASRHLDSWAMSRSDG